ncbi:MAG: hypothetical protein N5P05_003488 [Chroococcopsis gigantea SAG 12.99]|jgi:methyl-accepting chemotaxis protein|nr:GAF domain-containing protein [Chlorogloea purpurea SAG 13.99]MDV3001882.1 hypothetical protein [Chroococcopsis gigantea SAG 12.99]
MDTQLPQKSHLVSTPPVTPLIFDELEERKTIWQKQTWLLTLMALLTAAGITIIGTKTLENNFTELIGGKKGPSQEQIRETKSDSVVNQGLVAGSIGALLPLLAFLMHSTVKRKVKVLNRTIQEPLPKSLLQEDEFEQIGYKLEKLNSRLLEQEKANQINEEMSGFITGWLEESGNISDLLERGVKKALGILGADRVLIYTFNEEGRGYIAHEAVNPPWLSAKIERVNYRAGETKIVANNPKNPENFRLEIKAYMIIPIKDYGLIIVHQCSRARNWRNTEINFLKLWAAQVEMARDKKRREELQLLETRLATGLKNITLNISKMDSVDLVLQRVVENARNFLGSDRVILYKFDENWQGTIVSESVDEKYPVALNVRIADPCFADRYVDYYRQGRVKATADIFDAGLTPCHLQQLAPLGVRANLVTPIVITGELYGLLISHICSGPHHWEEAEINFLAQVATVTGTALEKIALLDEQKAIQDQQRLERERMQQRAISLLMEIDPLRSGDLSIHATVTEDEIGTIADSYNATIEGLRKLVIEVQSVTGQLTETSLSAEQAVGALNGQATRQKMEVETAMEQVAGMMESLQLVSHNADQALATVEDTLATVKTSEDLMGQSVEGMITIQETVGQTALKIALLSESSDKISKVVGLIGRFAAQTHLLALKASIEAARAGEEGRGFAVIADEVRTLAAQSAEATSEISALVNNIQQGTKEVAATMETGTQQVTLGASLVEETRRALNQITSASEQINSLVSTISQVAAQQTQTGATVQQLMSEVAGLSDNTMTHTHEVSDSFEYLLDAARSLAANVAQFKV